MNFRYPRHRETRREKIGRYVAFIVIAVGILAIFNDLFGVVVASKEPICGNEVDDMGRDILIQFNVSNQCPLFTQEVKCNTQFFDVIDAYVKENPSWSGYAERLREVIRDPDTIVAYFKVGDRIGYLQVYKRDITLRVPEGMCADVPLYGGFG